MSNRRTVAVRLRGKEYRVRSDEDEETLQRVARYLDETLSKVEEKTGTVDTLDAALLTAYACLPAMVGMLLGSIVRQHLPQETFRKVLLAALVVIGLNLIRRALF